MTVEIIYGKGKYGIAIILDGTRDQRMYSNQDIHVNAWAYETAKNYVRNTYGDLYMDKKEYLLSDNMNGCKTNPHRRTKGGDKEMRELHEAIVDMGMDGERIYLSDGVWLYPDGSMEDEKG